MKLYDYLTLDSEQQWNELWENGQFITNYKSIDCKYQLHALHDFFVEIELCISTDKIMGKSIFRTGNRIDKYAGRIDISAI